ncbi:purine-cytosine permease [Cordyceps fumosorosea ARSEF 2679]|uniref:Purine-cytosine permease n=1 Tax=Cordyceps fumosorosea (strain ARSEF 2679) TaxID=1081104 RepID=A0A167LDZ8_CORFA|nr:purine-cytosine permease [Cordyceps fumosorosea ARSEF 2679]OAA52974.1 purine-cytosine permease [Cordyceps fumosorosea ARSEF 2679]
MNNPPSSSDTEKNAGVLRPTEHVDVVESEVQPLSRFQQALLKLRVETRGIERVPDDERTDTSYLNIGSMWVAANLVVPSFTIGALGRPLFGVGFLDSVLVIVFFNLIGSATVCFFSTFGAAFGLRQMTLSRFWFGWWGVKITPVPVAMFNILASVGWAAANIIVGAQLLHAVNDAVPGYAGILVIAACTLLVVFFGYRMVHAYERWSWMPTLVVFLVVLGVFARSGDFVHTASPPTYRARLGAVLSYGSTVFGFGTGYTPFAADYTVYQPSNRPRRNVFLATWLGIYPTLLFTEILGAAIVTATALNGGDNPYQRGYDDAGIGGLLGAVLFERLGGFGKFCVVVLALSIVANNCPNIYSVSLTLMVLGRWTRRVPRFLWSALATGAYVAIAIPGYGHFETALENFMNLIAYWLAAYEGIVLSDHFIFKRGFSGYRPEHYEDRHKQPPGIAAILAFCFGIMGIILGMSQSWWTGPIARHAGAPPFGGDVGFECAFAFASVSYIIMRTVELKYAGR